MPASDQIKDGEDSTEIARQPENLPEYTCRRFDFRRQAKYYCPLNPGGPRRPCDCNHKLLTAFRCPGEALPLGEALR